MPDGPINFTFRDPLNEEEITDKTIARAQEVVLEWLEPIYGSQPKHVWHKVAFMACEHIQDSQDKNIRRRMRAAMASILMHFDLKGEGPLVRQEPEDDEI